MDQLTKLIEQYERENPELEAECFAFALDFTIWQANEIEKLSSRPTCTANERKFLDEIREKGEWASSHDAIWLDNGSEIFQSDFEVNLKELVDVT